MLKNVINYYTNTTLIITAINITTGLLLKTSYYHAPNSCWIVHGQLKTTAMYHLDLTWQKKDNFVQFIYFSLLISFIIFIIFILHDIPALRMCMLLWSWNLIFVGGALWPIRCLRRRPSPPVTSKIHTYSTKMYRHETAVMVFF